MADPSNNCRKINLMLLQESVWQVEDRMNVFIETLADQEAALIRLKGTVTTLDQRLNRLEKNRAQELSEEVNNG
ncbi:MAG: hypothetical protein GY847_23660 [Proteobacteria bacterium]|nr:hypothetical protein [Pseudomonadota bacterium]